MTALTTLRIARPAVAAFAAMGVVWGTFAAVLPDLKTMLGVDESRLGLLMLFTPDRRRLRHAAGTCRRCRPRPRRPADSGCHHGAGVRHAGAGRRRSGCFPSP